MKKRRSRCLIDPESQIGGNPIGEEIDVQFGITRAQGAPAGLVLQDQLAAREADVLEMGGCSACLRFGQEICEQRADVEVVGAGLIGHPCEADAAVGTTGERQGGRHRIDPLDGDPALEQQRRRAESDVDFRQLAQKPAIGVAHVHADRAQVERMILAQAQLRVFDVDRHGRGGQLSFEVGGQPCDRDRAGHQQPDGKTQRQADHRNQQ